MTNRTARAVASGLIGAGMLTVVHEIARRNHPDAPRMDMVGVRALRQLFQALGMRTMRSQPLHRVALAADLLANSLYYALVPASTRTATWSRAVGLGLAAGIGALELPEPLGLGKPPRSDRRANQLMTVAWYVAGAVSAAAAAETFGRRRTTAHA